MGYTKEKSKTLAVQLTTRELSTILAALRFWQRKSGESCSNQAELDIAKCNGPALSNSEIDGLWMSINLGGRTVIQMPDALTGNLTSAQDAVLLHESSNYFPPEGSPIEDVESILQHHRKASIRKHRNHALRLSEAGVYCKHCQELVIEDADAWPKKERN